MLGMSYIYRSCQAMLEAEKIAWAVNLSADGTLPMNPEQVED